MKIYISGQITGLPLRAAQISFERVEKFLKLQNHNPVNPMKIQETINKPWTECMIADIEQLMQCEAIYMMHNWGLSKGARIEYAIAKELGLEIIFEK